MTDIEFAFSIQRNYYIRDALHNIKGIVDSSGNTVVKYEYNAFGKLQNVIDNSALKISNINPFIYKGYFYVQEIELYYLKTRFYDPYVGRFISPDNIDYLDINNINGLNIFTYCGNDPVMYSDGSGHFPILACVLGITALVGLGLTIFWCSVR